MGRGAALGRADGLCLLRLKKGGGAGEPFFDHIVRICLGQRRSAADLQTQIGVLLGKADVVLLNTKLLIKHCGMQVGDGDLGGECCQMFIRIAELEAIFPHADLFTIL